MIKCPNCGHICANIYDSGMDAGYSRSRDELKEIIESMAYEIATHRNPRFYTHSDNEIESIMGEFGWEE